MIASRSSPWTRSRFFTMKSASSAVASKKSCRVRPRTQLLVDCSLDAIGVANAHGDYTQGFLGAILACSKIKSTTRSTSSRQLSSSVHTPIPAGRTQDERRARPPDPGTSQVDLCKRDGSRMRLVLHPCSDSATPKLRAGMKAAVESRRLS